MEEGRGAGVGSCLNSRSLSKERTEESQLSGDKLMEGKMLLREGDVGIRETSGGDKDSFASGGENTSLPMMQEAWRGPPGGAVPQDAASRGQAVPAGAVTSPLRPLDQDRVSRGLQPT